MKKFCLILSMLVAFGLFSISMTFAQVPDVPDWSVVGSIRDDAHQVVITEDLTGYPTPSDTGPYALGWVGHSKGSYCNTDRDFDFYNWVSVAQWMRITAENIDRLIQIRKPGIYTLADKPMKVRIASNGDVLVTFQEIWGDGSWNARWYEFTLNPNGQPPSSWDKTYPALAHELDPQIPVDKKYKIAVYGDVDAEPPTGFVDVPAGDGAIKFLNSQALHNLESPTNGFDLQFQEIVAPCNTTGDYVMRGRVIFQCYNQMWYIDPMDGQFDMSRDSNQVPPAPYQHNPM